MARPTVPLPEHDSAHPVEPSDPLGRRELAWEIDRALRDAAGRPTRGTRPGRRRGVLGRRDRRAARDPDRHRQEPVRQGAGQARPAARAPAEPAAVRRRPTTRAKTPLQPPDRPAYPRSRTMSQHHDPVHPDSDHLTPEVLADLDLGLLDDASAAHAEQHLDPLHRLCRAARRLHRARQCPDEPADRAHARRRLADAERKPRGRAGRHTRRVSHRRPHRRQPPAPLDPTRDRPGRRCSRGRTRRRHSGTDSEHLRATSRSTASDGGQTATAQPEASEVPMAAYAATSSGTKYEEAALDSQVTRLVASRQVVEDADLSRPATVSGTSPWRRYRPAATESTRWLPWPPIRPRRRPASRATSRSPGVQPLAIDIGTWQGEPAAVIVLPAADPTTRLRCGSSIPTATGPTPRSTTGARSLAEGADTSPIQAGGNVCAPRLG